LTEIFVSFWSWAGVTHDPTQERGEPGAGASRRHPGDTQEYQKVDL